MTKKVSHITLYVFLSLVLTAGAAALFTQTPMFRETLRSTLYTFLESELNADIYIGEINGNIVTGLTVDTVMMYVDGAPFVESGKLSIRYDLFDLLSDRITVDTLTIENPSVHLIRWKNGEWNFDRLSEPGDPADTSVSPLVVSAGKIRIINAQFHVTDSTGNVDAVPVDRNGNRSFNYSDIDLEQIHLELSGTYSSAELSASLRSLSFFSPKERFTLTRLSAEVQRTPEAGIVKNLVIQTPASRIVASAELKGIDPFAVRDAEELQFAQTTLSVGNSTIQTRDIQLFLPTLDFFRGSVNFSGEFQGNFEHLNVKTLNAAFGTSSLSLSGTVSNIYRPEDLRLNVVSTNSTVLPSDVPALMPFFGIPDYAGLGLLTIDFQFVGKPLDFLAISKITSAAGTVTVDGEMVITEENIHYKGLLAGSNVRLEKVFASDEFLSRLNTRIFVEGEGTSIASLKSAATVEIDSSMFRDIAVDNASVKITAADRKIDTELSLRSPEGNVTSRLFLDFNDESRPAYALTAAVRGLDLAPVLKDDYFSSRLSFDLKRSGIGLTLFDNPSDTRIDFFESQFKGRPFDSASVVMTWLKDSLNNDRLRIESPVADGELTGSFTFDGLIATIQKHILGLEKIYAYQRNIVDSTYHFPYDSIHSGPSVPSAAVAYDLTVKNLRPLSLLFNFSELDAVGRISGTISGDSIDGSSAGRIRIDRASYADPDVPIGVSNLDASYRFDHISPRQLLTETDPVMLSLDLEGEEVKIGETALRRPVIKFNFQKQQGQFVLGSDIDTSIAVFAEGKIDVTTNMNTVRFENLFAKYQGFDLRSALPFSVTLSDKGIRIDSSLFVRRDEEYFVRGGYDFSGTIVAEAKVRNFDLSSIFFVNTSPEFRDQVFLLGGKVGFSATVSGTAQEPVINASFDGTEISYRNSSFGDLTAVLQYANRNAGLTVEMKGNADSAGTGGKRFLLQGSVPIDLSFTSVEHRTGLPGMNVGIEAANVPMAMFDVFIPEIDQMSGTIDGSVRLAGSLDEPELYGTLGLNGGSFRMEMNGIYYTANGRIGLDSQRITFPEFVIRNTEEDYTDGVMNVGGYISMDGFAPAEYHLTANGELLVLQNRSRIANQSFFGTMVGRTGPEGLRFEGTFDRSRVIGTILVENASLTFPPTQQSVSFSTLRFDDVLFIDDTSRTVIDTSSTPAVTAPSVQKTMPKSSERTFLDGFGYELTIEIRGNATVQMIFNADAGTYEELLAELNGKMVMTKDEGGQRLTGSINVGPGSRYEFYKKFNATGSLTFVGDPQNPQLNILAKYEGIHLRVPGDPTTEERIVVSLEISGNRDNPKLKIGLATVDQSGREIPRTGDVENDAITFLLTSSQNEPGLFRDELSAVDRNKLGAQLNEAIEGTFINNLLSGLVNDFIEQNDIPYVKRVEVRGVTTETNINTVLEVSNAVINIGGKVFTDVNNTNVNIQIPVLGRQNRNFMFEVERKTETTGYISNQAQTTLGARLFYRFTF